MNGFNTFDRSFAEVLGDGARLVKVIDVDAHEGPVYAGREDALYFTTTPAPVDESLPGSRRVAIKRLALDGDRFPLEPDRVTVVVDDANNANGMTIDLDGRLVVCEQGSQSEHARISRLDPRTGRAGVVVDHWRGLRLNSPNDVVVRGDGTIWFTDPSYGHVQGFRPTPMVGDYVYRHDPATGRTDVVDDSFVKPNGIAFSPDERMLYVTDSGANHEPGSYYVDRPHHIVAFDVVDGGHLVNRRLFAVTAPGFPDGIKLDQDGRVYASAFSGVQVFDPAGDLIGEIALPGAVNFAFGGFDRHVLYITTDKAIWAADLNVKGA